jgi:hypothetical protein
MNMSPSVQDHFQRLLKTAAVVILAGLIFALCSCKSNDHQVIRTTTTRAVPGMFGASGSETTVVETPYESPSYTGGVMQLFAR